MLTAVGEGRLTLPRMVELCASQAATIFRLRGKGRIAANLDADLTLVDLGARWSTIATGRSRDRALS